MADAVSAPPMSPLISLECLCTAPGALLLPTPEPVSPRGRAALAARTQFVCLHGEPEVPDSCHLRCGPSH